MAETIDILIVDELSYLQEILKPMLLQEPRLKILGECQSESEALRMTEEYQPHMLIINYDSPNIDTIELTKKLLSMDPSLLIVSVFSQSSKTFIKEVMESGVKDYILKPFTALQVISTLINLHDIHDGFEKLVKDEENKPLDEKKKEEIECKVITLFGLKGGIGKSTLAVNLAVGLSRRTNKRVAIIDLDLQSGDIALMMNLFPKRTIADLTKDMHLLDEEIMEEYLSIHSSGVRVLPAPLSPEYSEYINPLLVEKIIKILSKIYHYIIIDTSPSFIDINLTALDMSNKIILMTTLDLLSVKSIKASLQIMKKLNYSNDKLYLVLNRYQRDLGLSIRNLEKSTGKKLLAKLPEDYETAIYAVNKGEPFIIKNPKIPLVKSIQGLVDYFG